jgi:short-subunit dehydrogenase
MADLRVAPFARRTGERGPSGVLVTGGSAGIGLAIAKEFAARGHPLLLIARGRERLEAAADELRQQYPVSVHTLALDVGQPDCAERIQQWLASSGFVVSHLVNSAGTWLEADLRNSDAGQLESLLATNVMAVHRLTRLIVPGMVQAGSGRILNVGSLAGTAPCPGFGLYGASKAFLHDMTLALRQELKGTGVTVSLLAPGVVRTGFFGSGSGNGDFWRLILQSAPETVARAAYRGHMNGQAVIVPGVRWRLMWLGGRVLPSRMTAWLISAFSRRFLKAEATARRPSASLARHGERATLSA